MNLPQYSAKSLLSEFYHAMFVPMRLAGKSESTKKKYRIAIGHLERFLSRPPLVEDLQDDTIISCLAVLQDRALSPATTNGYRGKFICLADYAFRKGVIPETLDIPKRKELRRQPNTLSELQMTALVAAAKTTPGMIGALPASLFWPALILTLYDTAARSGSILAAEWDDLDFNAGTIRLRAETAKTHRESSKPLHSDTIELLRSIQVILRDAGDVNPTGSPALAWAKAIGDPNRLFPWPYHPLYLWQKLDRVMRRAGIPAGRRWKFHAIRRTTLTLTADRLGVSAATDLADHTSDDVTRKSYLDRSRIEQQRPCDVLPRPGAAKAKPSGGTLRRLFGRLGFGGGEVTT